VRPALPSALRPREICPCRHLEALVFRRAVVGIASCSLCAEWRVWYKVGIRKRRAKPFAGVFGFASAPRDKCARAVWLDQTRGALDASAQHQPRLLPEVLRHHGHDDGRVDLSSQVDFVTVLLPP
jgi:hypothetical protein